MYKVNPEPTACRRASLTEVERRLVALRIAHTDDLDVGRVFDIIHGLWSDEDELTPDRALRRLDDHTHATLAVDTVHEDIAICVSRSIKGHEHVCLQFVEAANGRAHGVPEGEQQTHSRVRLLTT